MASGEKEKENSKSPPVSSRIKTTKRRTMNLQLMISSVEQSEKLKELGLNTPSFFYHVELDSALYDGLTIVLKHEKTAKNVKRSVPAYNVGELLEMLPGDISEQYYMRVEPDGNGWNITYFEEMKMHYSDKILVSINSEKLAHCLADCLIWLIETKRVNPEDLKL